ncbi:hypothetical protein ACFGVR_20045 [Mucilaginibacter sp. AW1-3]
MKRSSHINFILLALVIASCGSTTSIIISYKAPGVTQVSYKKVFIAALTENTATKQTVENNLWTFLGDRGVVSVMSTQVFSPDFHSSGSDSDKEVVLGKIRDTGCDGIFTVALVSKQAVTSYAPGSTPSGAGMGYSASFGAYYSFGNTSFYSPGYYTDDKVYYVETNLYDVKTEKLVWSAQSKTYDPPSLNSFLKSYEKTIARQVVKDELMAPVK